MHDRALVWHNRRENRPADGRKRRSDDRDAQGAGCQDEGQWGSGLGDLPQLGRLLRRHTGHVAPLVICPKPSAMPTTPATRPLIKPVIAPAPAPRSGARGVARNHPASAPMPAYARRPTAVLSPMSAPCSGTNRPKRANATTTPIPINPAFKPALPAIRPSSSRLSITQPAPLSLVRVSAGAHINNRLVQSASVKLTGRRSPPGPSCPSGGLQRDPPARRRRDT